MIKEENKRNIEMIKKTLGSIFMEKLQDPNVIEIMCNSDGSLWIDELGVGMSKVGSINPYNVQAAINVGVQSSYFFQHSFLM